jgi:sodium/bile acid cotransporter 7
LLVNPVMTSKWLGFERADRVTIIFCGSKKSLSQGITMAKIIFSSQAVGPAVLPLMLFHQIQLMVCAALAQRWGRLAAPAPIPTSANGKAPLAPAGAPAMFATASRSGQQHGPSATPQQGEDRRRLAEVD